MEIESSSSLASQIKTVPNLLSIARLGMFGVFSYLILAGDNRVAAFFVLGVAGVTDFLDGYIARHFNQVTELGKMLDPAADRILVGGALIVSLVSHTLPLVLGLVILAREIVMVAATLLLAAMGARRIDVIWLGKAGTFGLMCTIPLFILSAQFPHHSLYSWQHYLRLVDWVLIMPAIVFSYMATVKYIPEAKKALSERKAKLPEVKNET